MNTETELQLNKGIKASTPAHQGQGMSPAERRLVSRLQDAIEDNGRYSYRLKDLSVGYAAASGMSEHEARDKIGSMFQREIGSSLKEYLEQNREERGLSNDSNGRGR